MRGDRTNYGQGHRMRPFNVRLTQEEIAKLLKLKQSDAAYQFYTIPDLLRLALKKLDQ